MKNKIKVIILIIVFIGLFNPFTLQYIYNTINEQKDNSVFSDYGDFNDVSSTGEAVDENEIEKLKDSTVEWKNLSFDTRYNPYYTMLSNNEKNLYKQVYANANNIVSTFKPASSVSISEVKNVMEAIYDDHPELFWINTSYTYKYTKDNNVVQIVLDFNETSNNINQSKKVFDSEVNKIINNAKKYSSNYLREKYVYDTLVTTIKYDKNASMNQSAYSAIVNKKTICAGYSRAFQYILNRLGIPTYYVVGVANVNHAWNIVKLDDGYYNVDLTWGISEINRYQYFNKTDSEFNSTHKRKGLSLKLPTCNSKKYRYINDYTSNSNSNITSNSNSNSNVYIPNNNEESNSNNNNDNEIEKNTSNENTENSNNNEEESNLNKEKEDEERNGKKHYGWFHSKQQL